MDFIYILTIFCYHGNQCSCSFLLNRHVHLVDFTISS